MQSFFFQFRIVVKIAGDENKIIIHFQAYVCLCLYGKMGIIYHSLLQILLFTFICQVLFGKDFFLTSLLIEVYRI